MKIEHYSYGPEEREQELYQTIKAWAPDNFPIGDFLPKLGVIAFDDDGTPIAFLCADMSNNIGRAYLDYLQTNPEAGKMKRFRAVRMCEAFICEELKRLGYHQIMAVTKKAGIAVLSQSLGYFIEPDGYSILHKEF